MSGARSVATHIVCHTLESTLSRRNWLAYGQERLRPARHSTAGEKRINKTTTRLPRATHSSKHAITAAHISTRQTLSEPSEPRYVFGLYILQPSLPVPNFIMNVAVATRGLYRRPITVTDVRQHVRVADHTVPCLDKKKTGGAAQRCSLCSVGEE